MMWIQIPFLWVALSLVTILYYENMHVRRERKGCGGAALCLKTCLTCARFWFWFLVAKVIISMSALSAFLCVHHKYVWCPQCPWDCSYIWLWATTWVLGIQPDPLQEQVFLTTVPPLHSPFLFFNLLTSIFSNICLRLGFYLTFMM